MESSCEIHSNVPQCATFGQELFFVLVAFGRSKWYYNASLSLSLSLSLEGNHAVNQFTRLLSFL